MVAARDLCGCRAEWWKNGWVHVRCPLHTAAPDLLAASEGLLDTLNDIMPIGEPWEPAVKLRTAIAKAKGEA
jgi:hypothetical protein